MPKLDITSPPMPKLDTTPAETEVTKMVRARLQGAEERLKHLEDNHPKEVDAINKVKKRISELQDQLPKQPK